MPFCNLFLLTPCKVLDNTLCVQFDPNIEQDQEQTAGPTHHIASEETRTRAYIEPRQCKAHVRSKVIHKNEVHELTVQEPGIVLYRSRLQTRIGFRVT